MREPPYTRGLSAAASIAPSFVQGKRTLLRNLSQTCLKSPLCPRVHVRGGHTYPASAIWRQDAMDREVRNEHASSRPTNGCRGSAIPRANSVES